MDDIFKDPTMHEIMKSSKQRICTKCGMPFRPNRAGHHICYVCWEGGNGAEAFMREGVKALGELCTFINDNTVIHTAIEIGDFYKLMKKAYQTDSKECLSKLIHTINVHYPGWWKYEILPEHGELFKIDGMYYNVMRRSSNLSAHVGVC